MEACWSQLLYFVWQLAVGQNNDLPGAGYIMRSNGMGLHVLEGFDQANSCIACHLHSDNAVLKHLQCTELQVE